MIRPLQVTSRPRCTRQIQNQWFHGSRAETHQCPFPIWRDELCKRHHPTRCKAALERKVARLKRQLAEAESHLAPLLNLPPLPIEIDPAQLENAS